MKSVFKKVVGVLGGVTVGKLFWDQTEELAQEYEGYNTQLADSIARVRENFDTLQANCDRIAARTVGATLHKGIREELPVPTAADLKACKDKEERLRLWNTMLVNTLARVLCVSYAGCFTFLCARMQINLMHADAYCPDKSSQLRNKRKQGVNSSSSSRESGEEDESEEDEEEERDSAFREQMKVFSELRRTEYILNRGLKTLAAMATNVSTAVIKSEGCSLEKQMDYDASFQSLLFKAFERMNGIIYERMPYLISPLNSLNMETRMEPNVRRIYDFTNRMGGSNDFFFTLKACAGMQLMHIYERMCYVFEGQTESNNPVMVSKAMANVLPHLLRATDAMTETAVAASLFQVMGTVEMVDVLMFEIYRGAITS